MAFSAVLRELFLSTEQELKLDAVRHLMVPKLTEASMVTVLCRPLALPGTSYSTMDRRSTSGGSLSPEHATSTMLWVFMKLEVFIPAKKKKKKKLRSPNTIMV